MAFLKKSILSDDRGFAFIAALLATLILTAIGVLIFTLSTRDVRVGIRITGEKKAMSAAETGIQSFIQQTTVTRGLTDAWTATNVAVGTDGSSYSIQNNPTPPPGVPKEKTAVGYQLSGTGSSSTWMDKVINKKSVGKNDNFGSRVEIEFGIGYGPVDVSTSQPAAGG